MKDAVIVSACRTAIGGFGGSLRDSHAATIAGVTMRAAVKRAGIDPSMIDDVRYGCCMEPVDTLNVTRIAALLAGIPDTVTAVTINRVCISGMEAVISGAAMIQADMADVILAGGVEHMSGVPYSVAAADSRTMNLSITSFAVSIAAPTSYRTRKTARWMPKSHR